MNKFAGKTSTKARGYSIDSSGLFKDFSKRGEESACRFHAHVNLFFSILFLTNWVTSLLFRVTGSNSTGISTLYACSILFLVVPSLICLSRKGKGRKMKYFIMGSTVIGTAIMTANISCSVWIYMAMPIIVSCRFFDAKYTVKVMLVTLLSMLLVVLHTELFSISARNKITWQIIEDVIRSFILDYALSGMIGISFISVLIATIGATTIRRIAEVSSNEQQLKAQLMLDQLQPHFLYNTLTAIMAIEGNPDETVDAIAEFGQYLRENLQSVDALDLITFDKEIEHTARYISLQKLRFGDKLEIKFDLRVHDFMIPPLTVQMLVENAVRHGIRPLDGNGLVTVSTELTDEDIVIRVKDNGVGFDSSQPNPDDSGHIGLTSVRSRVYVHLNGTVSIDSKIGVGTEVTVCIPR